MAEGRLSHPIDDSAERACRASQMFSAGLPTLIMSFTRLTLALRKLWLGMSCGWPVEPDGPTRISAAESIAYQGITVAFCSRSAAPFASIL